MGGWKLGWRSLVLGGGMVVAGLAAANPAPQPAGPDADVVKQLVEWNVALVKLPDNMPIDPALREAAAQLAREHAQRVRRLAPAWIAEERAASNQPALGGRQLVSALLTRSVNETAIASVESTGPEHDQAWMKAALAPLACDYQSPIPFLTRMMQIQRAPVELRPALLAAETELLARWGTPRQDLGTRPSRADMDAADHAIALLRTGLPAATVPMTPFLAVRVFALKRSPDRPTAWERCAKSQWWLQSQLAEGKVDPAQALRIYRYATMLDLSALIPPGYAVPPAGEQGDAPPPYPPAAGYYGISGVLTLRASVDEQGQPLTVQLVKRQVYGPGVRGNPPVAFETVFDAVAIDMAKRRSYPAGKKGVMQFDLAWNLHEDDRDAD